MPDSQWLMIERHRLWQLTHELGEIAKSAQYAMERVQELEEETGVRLWSR
ncbi:hypothetical protein [Methylohalobius crimeensis]|nr:hypothetical protein [Methylohalobius crimeensis]